MRGLYLKDWYSVRSLGRKYFIFLFGFIILMSFVMKSSTYMTMMGIVISTNLLFLIFGGEEQGGRGFLLQLPVSRKQLVLEKYVFSLGFYFIYHVFAGIISFLVALFHHESIEDAVFSFGFMLALNIILMAVMLPVLFLKGVNTARIVMIVGMMLLAVGFFMLLAFSRSLGLADGEVTVQNSFLFLIVAGALVIYVISGILTDRAFARREE